MLALPAVGAGLLRVSYHHFLLLHDSAAPGLRVPLPSATAQVREEQAVPSPTPDASSLTCLLDGQQQDAAVPTTVSCQITSYGMPCVCSFDVLGIHGNPLRSLPLFTVYLATLVHTYRQGDQRTMEMMVGRVSGTKLCVSLLLPPCAAWPLGRLHVKQLRGSSALQPRSSDVGTAAMQSSGTWRGNQAPFSELRLRQKATMT